MTSLLPSSSFVTAVAAPLAAPLQSHPVSASTKEEPDSTSSMQPISAPSIPSSQLPSFSLPATATPNPSPVALTPVSAATILPHSKSRKKKKALLAELQNLDDPNAASLTEVQSTRSSAPLVPSMIDIHQGQSLPSETASSATPTATLANFDDQSAPSPQNTQPHPSTTPPLELSVDAQPVQSSSGDSTCPAVPEATPVVPTSGSFRQVEGHSSIGPERARSVSSAPNFLDGPLKSQSPVLERATKIQLRPSSSPVLDRAPGSHSPATNFLDQAFTSPPPSLSLAHLTAPSNSVAVEHQPAERRQMPSHDVQESVEMTSLKPTEKIKDAMEVDSDPLVGGETADKTTDDAMDVDVVQQIPSMDSMLPMPLSAESAPSAASAPLVRGNNKIQICQNGDLSGYVFCLHIHTPTLAQVQKLNKMLQDETEWEEWKRSVSGPINIPPSRFLQEM
ncbi:hypothetical protein GYMLUDRAFT_451479 [Collybiopsis luxurians FD-317 M1]|uniref:Uncharacterized protein n=1 Tax=Collybiopsis luxurians FD-317 M1 TaxID=944289 RepID=A0A0D0C6I9_9AGAR|nr:hypothetical protein GYMLUDRAFT_451479 [Collybiopsis luxurians FD-317 M1]